MLIVLIGNFDLLLITIYNKNINNNKFIAMYINKIDNIYLRKSLMNDRNNNFQPKSIFDFLAYFQFKLQFHFDFFCICNC